MNDTCTHMLFYSATTWMKAMGSCPYCENADLRKRLEEAEKVIDSWATQTAKFSARAEAAEKERYKLKERTLLYTRHGWFENEDCPACILEAKLARYDQAVEVEGVVEQYLHSFGNGMYEEAASIILPSECNQFIGQRVTVLVMTKEGD